MDDLKQRHDLGKSQQGGAMYRPAVPWWRPLLGPAMFLAGFLLVVGGIVWWVYSRPAAPPPGGRFSGMPSSVGVAAAETGAIKVVLNALGTVSPLATVTVKAQIAGQLMHIAFTEGQTVNKGDLLAEIDSRPYEAQLSQNEGQLLRDQALLREAQIDLKRYQTLASQDSIPKQQAEDQAELVHQYEGTVKSDEAQVTAAKLNITYCHIIAPVTGKVGLRQVDQGNYVQLSDANGLVILTQMQPITVIFTLPEDALPQVARALAGGKTLAVTAYDRGRTTKLADGVLMTVDNQIDTSTGTVKLRAQFDNKNFALFPNQFVNIDLLVDTLTNATVVSAAAVQHGTPGAFVYLVKPDNTVAVTPVKLGPVDGERVAVLSGLTVGDRLVVDGADKLKDGATVVVRGDPAAPGERPADAAHPRYHRTDGGAGAPKGAAGSGN